MPLQEAFFISPSFPFIDLKKLLPGKNHTGLHKGIKKYKRLRNQSYKAVVYIHLLIDLSVMVRSGGAAPH